MMHISFNRFNRDSHYVNPFSFNVSMKSGNLNIAYLTGKTSFIRKSEETYSNYIRDFFHMVSQPYFFFVSMQIAKKFNKCKKRRMIC